MEYLGTKLSYRFRGEQELHSEVFKTSFEAFEREEVLGLLNKADALGNIRIRGKADYLVCEPLWK